MHRYQPRFHIVYLPPKNSHSPYQTELQEYNNHYRRFIFPETSFTAVTAYQNQRVSPTANESFSFNLSLIKRVLCVDLRQIYHKIGHFKTSSSFKVASKLFKCHQEPKYCRTKCINYLEII